MKTLYAFIGEATHEDSRDGLEEYVIISEDIPASMASEVLGDKENAVIKIMSREDMESLVKSIGTESEAHGIGDGYILDLEEPYILRWKD